jgi:hypothetical protein
MELFIVLHMHHMLKDHTNLNLLHAIAELLTQFSEEANLNIFHTIRTILYCTLIPTLSIPGTVPSGCCRQRVLQYSRPAP